MERAKQIAAMMCALLIALALTACGGNPAPEEYDLSAAGVKLDSFTKVVGERGYTGMTTTGDAGSTSAITVNYSGVTNPIEDLSAYADYLRGRGFIDYFGLEGTQMCVAQRSGDGAVLVSGRMSGDQLELRVTWQPQLELVFGETQYVSGSSLAILPGNELVVFNYPVLSDGIASQETVNQQILDGVNQMMQYAAETAGGAVYKLMGTSEVTSALASNVTIELKGELTVGDTTTELSSTVQISDLMGEPAAVYSEVAAQ